MSFLPAFHAFSGPFVYKAARYYHNNPPTMPYLRKRSRTGRYVKGTPGSRRSLNRGKTRPSSGGRLTRSRGLSIGKRRKQSFRQLLQSTINPPMCFNSKWNFQMDCDSGRTCAVGIPVLTGALFGPLFDQLAASVISDTLVTSPTLGTGTQLQQKCIIDKYLSKLSFYNSSTNACKCKLVWYRPKFDFPHYFKDPSSNNIPNTPINMLMYASTINQPKFVSGSVASLGLVGNGIVFNNSSTVIGNNWYTDYNHAGAPYYNTANTTASQGTINNVAQLDPSLVPGSPQVRGFVNRFWRTVKAETFDLEPGVEYRTSLSMKNRIPLNSVDFSGEIKTFKNSTVIGVLYVLGQTVWSNVALNSTITTGSSQILVRREDTCQMKIDTIKNTVRVNMTNQLEQLPDLQQSVINTTTDGVDDTYGQDEL